MGFGRRVGFAAHVATRAWIRPGRDAARTMASNHAGSPTRRGRHERSGTRAGRRRVDEGDGNPGRRLIIISPEPCGRRRERGRWPCGRRCPGPSCRSGSRRGPRRRRRAWRRKTWFAATPVGRSVQRSVEYDLESRFFSHKGVTCVRKIFTTNSIIRDPPFWWPSPAQANSQHPPFFTGPNFYPKASAIGRSRESPAKHEVRMTNNFFVPGGVLFHIRHRVSKAKG